MELSEAQAFCFQKWNAEALNTLHLSYYQTNTNHDFCFQAAQIFASITVKSASISEEDTLPVQT